MKNVSSKNVDSFVNIFKLGLIAWVAWQVVKFMGFFEDTVTTLTGGVSSNNEASAVNDYQSYFTPSSPLPNKPVSFYQTIAEEQFIIMHKRDILTGVDTKALLDSLSGLTRNELILVYHLFGTRPDLRWIGDSMNLFTWYKEMIRNFDSDINALTIRKLWETTKLPITF